MDASLKKLRMMLDNYGQQGEERGVGSNKDNVPISIRSASNIAGFCS